MIEEINEIGCRTSTANRRKNKRKCTTMLALLEVSLTSGSVAQIVKISFARMKIEIVKKARARRACNQTDPKEKQWLFFMRVIWLLLY
ncbi:hypothetical protein IHE45_19G088800 [Dioscorea alata]|uniref:Uncharacterized protein n=1 Tax=Dioscorea alata TaxID=55571 RepID=A0ACB7TZW5_DIOAL|nr:hypothetical protein IHE45_19G088800 [Dioscorea alata]